MNNPSSAPHADIVGALDNALNPLRADPEFWGVPLESTLQRLFESISPILHLDRIALYQAQQLHCCVPPDIDTAAAEHRAALRLPILLTASPWGELLLSRQQGDDWSPDERHAAQALADLIAQQLLQLQANHARRRFQGLAQDAPVAIVQSDENRQVVYRNQRMVELLGSDFSAIDDALLSRFIESDRNDNLIQDIETLERTGQIQRTYRITHADGSVRHALWHVITEQRDPHVGAHPGRLGVGIDITNLWQTQQELATMTLQQRAILDHAAHAIIATDSAANITLFNPAAERLLGYQAAEVIGRSARLLHLPDEIRQAHDSLRQQNFDANIAGYVDQAEQAGKEMEWTYVHKDGSHIPVAISATPLRDRHGNTNGYMGIVIDLRERAHLVAAEEREQALIKHISRGINATVGEQFFDHLIGELRNTLQADHLNIIELEPDREPLQGRPLSATNYDIPNGIIFFTGTPLEDVMRNGRSLHLQDLHRQYPQLPLDNIYELIAIPLIASNNTVLGALVAAHGQAFAEPHLVQHLLEIFAVRASTELERVRKERIRHTHDTEQRWLYIASETIHAQQEVEYVAREAVLALERHHSQPRVTFAINEGDTYRIIAYAGPAEKAPQQKVYPRVPTLFGGVINAKNSILMFPDFIESARGDLSTDEFVSRELRAAAIIGLIDQGIDIGAITLEYSDPATLGRLNQDVLGMFGRAVTLALGRAQHRQKLEYQATHDALTGLFNRSTLHHEFRRWRDEGGQHTALLLLDLDHFKDVNDTFGHHIGDGLLLQVGARLRAGLNYRKAKLTRLGGDEFAVLLLDRELAAEHALALAKNIQAEIRKPFRVNGINLEIGVSIGIALYPEHGNDSHELLRSADVAMYENKRSGSGVGLYHHRFDRHSPERLALISDLGHGIRNRQLTLHYQPKIDLRSGAIAGFEGLLRWHHPQHGLLIPGVLLPLIEMSDAIHELTRAILEAACAQLNNWIDAGKPWELSINLSARNLIDDRIVHHLARLMQTYALPPGRLELEITESALIKDPRRALELLDRIAALGIRLSIDDFGTGYSSLAYLHRMPISALKINRTFICEMLSNPQDQLIVGSIIQLAHGLNLKLIAEGVESAELAARLRDMGCDQAQGFYFTQALPLNELNQWLAQREGN
jgi:diguanylate cyclase (GGDEF)-like protein/PAS domain S-box-containing protein